MNHIDPIQPDRRLELVEYGFHLLPGDVIAGHEHVAGIHADPDPLRLADAREDFGQPKRVGVCMDTCHMFVSGYDVTGKKMKTVLDQFEAAIGLDRIDVVHCNDTLSD